MYISLPYLTLPTATHAPTTYNLHTRPAQSKPRTAKRRRSPPSLDFPDQKGGKGGIATPPRHETAKTEGGEGKRRSKTARESNIRPPFIVFILDDAVPVVVGLSAAERYDRIRWVKVRQDKIG